MFQGQSGSGGGLTILVLQMAAIGLVFYFLILRPSGQARKKHAELLAPAQEGRRGDDERRIDRRVKDIKDVESDGVKETRVTVEIGHVDGGRRAQPHRPGRRRIGAGSAAR